MANSTTLNRTKQKFICVGELYESTLKREPTKIKVRDESGNNAGTVDGERIMGQIYIKNQCGTHQFSVYGQNLTNRNKPSKMWDMYVAMLNWNPKVKGDSSLPVTKVSVNGNVEVNDFVNKQGQLSEGGLRWRVSSGREIDDAKYDESVKNCELVATLMLGSVVPEVKDEEETGRLIATFYGANSSGSLLPIKAFVPADMAEDFQDAYEPKCTASFIFENRLVGKAVAPVAKVAFGKGRTQKEDSYERFELICTSGFPPIEEPESLTEEDEDGNTVEIPTEWINPEAIKKAIKVRKEYLESLKNEGYKGKKTEVKPSASNKISAMKKQSKNNIVEDDDFFGDDDIEF